MIWGAALLLLAGLGLFVGGVLTGTTALYWACVGVCALAAVLLMAARRPAEPTAAPASPPPAAASVPPRASEPEPPRSTSPAAEPGAEPAQPVEPARRAEVPEPPGRAEPTDCQDLPGPAAPRRVGDEELPPVTGETTAGRRAWGAGGRRHRGAHSAPDVPSARPSGTAGEPGVEEVEVTDLLLVVDLTDEVLVVDEHPRYHLAGCRYLHGRETIPLPLDEARTDGFTPCGICTPDRNLAERERARR